LLGFLRLLDVPTASDIDLATREVLDRALSQLAHTGIVAVYEDGLEPVYAIPADAGMAAAYYKNTFVHFLVTSAIAEFALLQAAESPAAATETSFHEEALRLRDMLKFEFFFPEKDAFLEKMDAEMDLRFDGWRTRLAEGPAGIGVVLEGIDPLLTAGTLRAFLESYLIVADALQQHGTSEPIETKSFIRHCTALGRQRVLQKRVTSIESVSRAYLESALKLAGSRGLFEGESEALQLARDEFAADLNQLVQRAERLAAIQLSRGNRDRQRPGRAI
jgi:glycerol-3-phosphate O-acyltransferase